MEGRPQSRAERLRWAIEDHAGISIRSLSQDLSEENVRGSSYRQVLHYLSEKPGSPEPNLEFLEAAASHLGVRLAWLALGEGEPTEEGEAAAEEWWRSVREAPERRERRIAPALEIVGSDRQAQDALRRFDGKLHASYFPGCPWEQEEDHGELLRLAARFLTGTDESFRSLFPGTEEPRDVAEGMRVDRQLLRTSAAPGWRSQWYDALLVLFASRVKGLGERTESWHDAHSPASSRRSSSPAEEE